MRRGSGLCWVTALEPTRPEHRRVALHKLLDQERLAEELQDVATSIIPPSRSIVPRREPLLDPLILLFKVRRIMVLFRPGKLPAQKLVAVNQSLI